jgi:hypothetical protein
LRGAVHHFIKTLIEWGTDPVWGLSIEWFFTELHHSVSSIPYEERVVFFTLTLYILENFSAYSSENGKIEWEYIKVSHKFYDFLSLFRVKGSYKR